MESIQDVWSEICDYCKTRVNEVTYNAWFTLLSLKEISGSKATLLVKTNFQRNIILENYKDILDDAFLEVLKFPVNLTISTEEEKPISPIKFVDTSAQYDYTFETFIVGSSNRFAHAASLAVAENDSVIYNPLFIWGNSGLGKTHLLSAIATKVKENFPQKKVISVTCEAFANEFFYCLQHGTMSKFRDKYRTVDVLLIDDIQFIAGKDSTEEEFFNTFNDLSDNHKQIVLTSDRTPKDISSISDRLRSRFEAGLIADIQPPEYETRVGIIKRKAQLMNFNISEEITTYIADNVKCNIRQLEGVVKKLQASSMIYNNLTIAVAENAIRDIKKDDQPEPVTIQKVVEEVSKVYKISIEDIYSQKQDAEISHARQAAMYIIRKISSMTYDDIGKPFGGKNHATVLYACKKILKICQNNPKENQRIEDIMKNMIPK